MAKFNKEPILIDGVAYDIVFDNIPCANCPFYLSFCSDIRGQYQANINGEDKIFNCHVIMSENDVTDFEYMHSRFERIII